MKISLSDIDFGIEEEQAVLRVLRGKWLSMGQETEDFEREFAGYMGVKHAVAVSSGTAALHLAMLALGIGPGDAVLQPALNFVAAANMTLAVGAVPVFVDICSLAEPTISPESILDALSTDDGVFLKSKSHSNPSSIIHHPPSTIHNSRIAAVVVMHYGGYPCRMDEIAAICRERGLALIEDACHAVGGIYKGEPLAKPAVSQSGTGILPVIHGRDAHAMMGSAKASYISRLNISRP